MASKTKYVDASRVQRNLQRLATTLPAAVREAWLKQVAAAIVRRAKELCPVGKTGHLQRSIRWDPNGANAVIIHANMEYAAAQHENLQYHHDVGQAKYIEQALMEKGLGDAPKALRDEVLRQLRELG